MRNIIASLEKNTKKIQLKCEQRDKAALSRSDNWRESISGQKYEARTKLLADTVFTLRDSIRNIKNALEI